MYQGLLRPPLPSQNAGPPAMAPDALPMPAASLGGAAPPAQSADDLHRQRSQDFANAAIASFMRGEITRGQLSEALGDESNYDWQAYKSQNIVHPSRAVAHNVAAEEPSPAAPAAAGR